MASTRVLRAARKGHKATLEVARDTLARAIDADAVPGYKLSDALRTLADITAQLDALSEQEEGDDIGEAAGTPDEEWNPY